MTRNKLYTIVAVVWVLSSLWIVYSLFFSSGAFFLKCPFKAITTIPCPACGTTTGLMSLLKGEFTVAFLSNPLSYLALLIMIILPFWIIIDLVTRGDSLFLFYQWMEVLLRKRYFYVPAIIVIITIWAHNIIASL